MAEPENLANRIKFDELYDGSFYPEFQALDWSKAAGGMLVKSSIYLFNNKILINDLSFLDDDGSFIYRDGNYNIILEHVADKNKKTLVNGGDITDVSI